MTFRVALPRNRSRAKRPSQTSESVEKVNHLSGSVGTDNNSDSDHQPEQHCDKRRKKPSLTRLSVKSRARDLTLYPRRGR